MSSNVVARHSLATNQRGHRVGDRALKAKVLPESVRSRDQRRKWKPTGTNVICTGKGFGPTNKVKGTSKTENSKARSLKDRATAVSKFLAGTNLVFLGDSTKMNAAVATAVAPLLGYTPLQTLQIIEQLKGQPMSELDSEEIGLTEALVMENLSDHVRCSISTYGNGVGAAARGDCWRFMFGAVTVWLDIEAEGSPGMRLQDEAYSQCDVHLQIKNATEPHHEVQWSEQSESIALTVLPDLFAALETTLSAEKDLCKKKNLYVRLGCRGDWPDIDLPDWAAK